MFEMKMKSVLVISWTTSVAHNSQFFSLKLHPIGGRNWMSLFWQISRPFSSVHRWKSERDKYLKEFAWLSITAIVKSELIVFFVSKILSSDLLSKGEIGIWIKVTTSCIAGIVQL